jgi:hypothetical protein
VPVPDKPFQASLVFPGEAGAYPSEAPFRPHPQILERLARDKRSSLLRRSLN